jgi:hypothetical protein
VKLTKLAVSAGVLMAALLPGAAMAIPMPGGVDQFVDHGSDTIGAESDLAQTFTAAKTGLLTHVQIYMNGTGPIFLQLEHVTGGLPDDATPTIEWMVGTPSNSDGWVDFEVGGPVPVTAGAKYALVFNTGAEAAAWGSDAAYSGGQALTYNGSDWVALSGAISDFAFKTFVDPQTTTVQWDKMQVVAGTSTPLVLTETIVFPMPLAQFNVSAVKPAYFTTEDWLVKLDALPSWFTASDVQCVGPVAPADCNKDTFKAGSTISVAPGETITLTLTGVASPALADVGTAGVGAGQGCARFNELVDGPGTGPIVSQCVAAQATVSVVAPTVDPTPTPTPTPAPTTTLPPTTSGNSRPSGESGSAWILLGAFLAVVAAGLLVYRPQRRVR